uniref:Uncharacterized protein n=1 Tax=Rhizophora mucronata TaxID=61149 RepID=A0A2P2L735_RHIMU
MLDAFISASIMYPCLDDHIILLCTSPLVLLCLFPWRPTAFLLNMFQLTGCPCFGTRSMFYISLARVLLSFNVELILRQSELVYSFLLLLFLKDLPYCYSNFICVVNSP